MSHRVEQVARLIQEEVDSIIRYEMEDPRIGMAAVTRVNVSPDLENATIFVTVMDAEEEHEVEGAVRALSGAESFIRRELAQRLDLRHVPKVHFRRDRGEENARRITEILSGLEIPPDAPASDTPR
jgi:ribosome-binding factor A